MKKISILLSTVALVCAMTISCSKEENSQSGKDQFYAAVDNSKAALTGTGVTTWNTGDMIKVFGYDEWGYNLESHYTLVGGAGTSSGVFEGVNDGSEWVYSPLAHGPYMAFYPVGGNIQYIVNIGEYDGESTLTNVYLPYEQRYTGEGLPMYARSETRQLNFSHMQSILKLHIQADDTYITHIFVTADKAIAGSIPVEYDANGNPYLTAVDAEDEYDNMCDVRVSHSINDGLDVYIGLPVGTYSSLQLDIHASGDMVCTKTLSSSFTFERNKMYPVSLEGLVFVPYEEE